MTMLSTICRILQGINNAVIRWMLRKICKKQIGTSLSCEHSWYPGEWIIKIPNSNSDTRLLLHASIDRRRIIDCLLCEIRGGLGFIETDVEFSVSDLETHVSEELDVLDLIVEGGCLADDEVALQTDTINADYVC